MNNERNINSYQNSPIDFSPGRSNALSARLAILPSKSVRPPH